MTNDRLSVLYLASKRAVELPELQHLANDGTLQLHTIALNPDAAGPGVLRRLFQALQYCRAERPDVVLSERFGMVFYGARWIRALTRIPLAVRVKGDPWAEYGELADGQFGLKQRIKRTLNYRAALGVLRAADMLLPLTQHMADVLQRQMPDTPALVQIPIRHHVKASPPPTADAVAAINDASPFVLTVTNFEFVNKVRPLYRAIETLHPIFKQHNVRWLILGKGAFLKPFKTFLVNNGFDDIVTCVGFADTSAYYARALAQVYYSDLDVMPNVILESMAHGVPIITHADMPAVEMIEHEKTGFIIGEQSPTQVDEALQRVLFDKPWRASMIDNARAQIDTVYGTQRIAAQLLHALRSAAQR